MRVGKSFDGFVNVLTIINADCPILEGFHRVFCGSAHRGICVRFLDDCGLVCRETCLICDIIQRNNGGLKSDFAEVLRTYLIERRVCLHDRIFHCGLDGFRRLLPIGNGQHRVGFRRSGPKVVDRFQFGG